MKSKEIFSLIVRLIGLLFLYDGFKAVPNAIASICLVFPHFFFRNLWPNLFLIGWPLLVAYWLIRGAPWLMRLAYGEDSKEGTAPGPKPLT